MSNIVLFPGTYHSDRKPRIEKEPEAYFCPKCKSFETRNWADGVVSCADCGEINMNIRCYAVATLGFDDGA